ncbi:GIY-YIG nuclease family protein [Haoranjiania flava]|uniref:GIY-YIG nuclease family protein n=1 Tax=Haoranjiania flava TaxID=1856322 RepID=A0AAE3LRM5_9BACT|nr:GIY-YIG nuclease family protein [Haoranjiania flava]MCU7695580.1 GIY-YIG nuclease family protein [Haoranjiania flava]
MKTGGSVYIMTNFSNTVLYTGVTSNLLWRVMQHKNEVYPNSFTSKYNCNKLVYYPNFPTIQEAISEEKRIKAGSRNQKIHLITVMNPEWEDLLIF